MPCNNPNLIHRGQYPWGGKRMPGKGEAVARSLPRTSSEASHACDRFPLSLSLPLTPTPFL